VPYSVSCAGYIDVYVNSNVLHGEIHVMPSTDGHIRWSVWK